MFTKSLCCLILLFCAKPVLSQTLSGSETARHQKEVTVCFYLQDGVEVLDFAGPMEVFALAGFKVFTMSLRKEPITTQGILRIIPDYGIDDAPAADMLAFFGGEADRAS